MSTPSGPGGEVLGHNLVTRPTFTDLPSGTPATGWIKGTGTTVPTVGGTDRNGDPIPLGLLHVSPADYFSTLLGDRVAGEQLHVWVDAQAGGAAASGISLELVTALTAPLGSAGPSCAVLDTTARAVHEADLVVPADGAVWLRVAARRTVTTGTITLTLYGARADAHSDGLGIFSGATPDTEAVAYSWAGDPFASPSLAVDPTVVVTPPEEPTEPGMGQYVADLLGAGHDPALVSRAQQAVTVVTGMAHSYTRGRGFSSGVADDGIEAVIVTATMRLLGNPEQVDHGTGSEWTRGGFTGWTLAELYVLNGYRKRASG